MVHLVKFKREIFTPGLKIDLAGTDMTTSMTTDANGSQGSSSDNESWTILDEDDHETDRLVTLNTRIDVIKATAQFTKREMDNHGKILKYLFIDIIRWVNNYSLNSYQNIDNYL